ncbi:M66 family metalloprotease [Veronia pacifica]|uniref:Peptidase M66 domain-containing protein n=1 Tax=Veronia pacifica TaxID=1080227 RepID=A0A1C3EM92_9GAMM|nr:M66 family metalloprotease [Veronia pacifica]ODA34341.1 hypothetical protein A8L45_06345 [Veronia pacifica]
MKRYRLIVSLAFVVFCNTACEGDKVQQEASVVEGAPNKYIDIIVSNGYLNNATVWLDQNVNFRQDENEPVANSDANGVARLNVSGIDFPERFPVVAAINAGSTIDVKSNKALEHSYFMSSPPGVSIVTPLTTIVDFRLHQLNLRQSNSLTQSQILNTDAISWVSLLYGLDREVVTSDFMKNQDETAQYIASNLVESGLFLSITDMFDTGQRNRTFAQTVSPTKDLMLVSKAIMHMVSHLKEQGITSMDKMTQTFIALGDAKTCPDSYVQFNNYCGIDSDFDGIGNLIDNDDDEDGFDDNLDRYPLDASEYADSDNDGIGDNRDNDDDNDGVVDSLDALPLNPLEWQDTDGDTIGNNADIDDDNDGVPDINDAFPLDAGESIDTDADGIGNNADTDDDGDGVADVDDEFPLDSSQTGPQYISHDSYIDFNKNQFNDLSGTLSGYLLFGQHAIIPASDHIGNDRQPHLTGNRKTLVLLRPNVPLSDIDSLNVTVKSNEGAELFAAQMLSPERLPKVAGQTKVPQGFDSATMDFTLPTEFDHYVAGQNALNQLDKNGSRLNAIFESANTVKVSTYNGAWRRSFYLPESNNLNGKKIVFQSSAGYGSTVNYGKLSRPLNNGSTLVFVNIHGTWLNASDFEYSKIRYGDNFWTAVIPAKHIQTGIQFQFSLQLKDTKTLDGKIDKLHVGPATELILHTIDVGMLTKNREGFLFQYDERYAREYFQTLPASRLIMSTYEPQYFTEVMMYDGTLLVDKALDNGGWHSGSMREAIGKMLISIGINNANYGINASDVWMQAGRGHPYSVAQLTAHNTVGVYQNGVIVHGGSGGAGMVTLDSSIGNEMSHELGHNYSLGHYPGGFIGTIHKPADQVNSTWGWESEKNLFVPNFGLTPSNTNACLNGECVAPFNGHRFGSDSMGGGAPHVPSVNAFTMYTPYSAKIIQSFFESKALFSPSSSTGFIKWDPELKQMKEWQHSVVNKTLAAISPSSSDEASVANLLQNYDGVSVHFSNGYWAGNIHIPSASAENNGKMLKVGHSAGWNSRLHINDSVITLSWGTVKNYQSDGETWVEMSDLNSLTVPRKPERFGVPVTTLVGYFDPERKLSSYIYPALHGSYGMVYAADSDNNQPANSCYLVVTSDEGKADYYLSNHRFTPSRMNQFNVNIETETNPTKAEIVCEDVVVASRDISPPKKKLNTYIVPQNDK